MVQFEAEILDIRDVSETVKIFYFSNHSEFKPKPGQYAWISLPGFIAAPMAVASNPSEDRLIFAIRKWGKLTEELFGKKIGNKVTIEGPHGSYFPVERIDQTNKVYLIAGGTGITPIRSLVKNSEYTEKFNLFFGVKSDRELLLLQEISKWPLKTHLIVEEESQNWNGKIGLVTDLFSNFNFDINGIIFVCGPKPMMIAVIEFFRNLGFHDDKIYVSLEKFDENGNVVGPVLSISNPLTGF